MRNTAITVENLSKRYFIGHRSPRGEGLRHALERVLLSPWQCLKNRTAATEEFWALKHISFEVKTGQVVGIIGRNGAGKSTLLKLLSRITEPTSGRFTISGRVTSLLEVGTGFHPELTGRENIYLNGAILGMPKAEIKRKFDEIVTFSEIENFLDTPAKRYSSGMYVRLAFAVAAHLEPDILIVDEVLAVGDAQFQKKCLGKMEHVATKEGRTVLFVSHNMGSIIQFCGRGILLEKGGMVMDGPIDSVIKAYVGSASKSAVWQTDENTDILRARKKCFFTRVELCDSTGMPSGELDVRKPFSVNMEYEVPLPLKPVELAIRILTMDGRPVFTSLLSDFAPELLHTEKEGTYRASVEVPGMFLMPGNYMLNVAAHAAVGEVFDDLPGVFSFAIHDTGTNYTKYAHNHLIGVVIKTLPWRDEPIPHHAAHDHCEEGSAVHTL